MQCKGQLDEHGDGADIVKGETDKFANAPADGFCAVLEWLRFSVSGIDVHPLAVHLARAAYLILGSRHHAALHRAVPA